VAHLLLVIAAALSAPVNMSHPDAEFQFLSDCEVQDLQRAFDLFDCEKKGFVYVRDLIDILNQIVKDAVSVKDVLDTMRALPADTTLAMDGFVQILTQRGGPSDNRDDLRKVFDMFDKDGKGCIDINDLRTVAKEMGESLSDEDIVEMISRASSSGQQYVSYEEFSFIMNKKLFD
jgi:Ca2+-binding EF-hand superfamily protein